MLAGRQINLTVDDQPEQRLKSAAPAAPAAPTAKAKAMPQTIAPEIAGMPRAKRQAEARKKTDQAPHHCFRLALLKQPCGDGSKPLCI